LLSLVYEFDCFFRASVFAGAAVDAFFGVHDLCLLVFEFEHVGFCGADFDALSATGAFGFIDDWMHVSLLER